MKNRFVLLSLAAAFTLAACSGGSSSQKNASSSPAASPAATGAASPVATIASMKTASSNGMSLFNSNCSSCHQTNGKGSPGAFPPLAGNAVVTGPAVRVIGIVKNGLSGQIKVNGIAYNGQMPSWKMLSSDQIASIITYIRSAWGNHASAVTPAQVAAVK